MCSLVLIGFLFTPVDSRKARQPADEPLPIPTFANLLRGRVLARNIKKGMTEREVGEKLGSPTFGFSSCALLCWDNFYDDLGIAVAFETKRYKGENGMMRLELVVTGMRVVPLLDFLPWFHSDSWIDYPIP